MDHHIYRAQAIGADERGSGYRSTTNACSAAPKHLQDNFLIRTSNNLLAHKNPSCRSFDGS
jgi:hypothetical protein